MRKNSSTDPLEQYVWHPHYVDALCARFWDGDANGNYAGTNEIHFATQDANFNVTALVDTAGTVIERYKYTLYGQVVVLDANLSVDADGKSDVVNPVTYTGRRFDDETGLYYYRFRYYHAEMGRFVSRDPIDYSAGWNLYRYSSSDPVAGLDPTGLADFHFPTRRNRDGSTTVLRCDVNGCREIGTFTTEESRAAVGCVVTTGGGIVCEPYDWHSPVERSIAIQRVYGRMLVSFPAFPREA